jgi:hypothetical protein
MGLLRGLLTFPASVPVAGTLWVARKIHEAAEAEFRDPAAIRRALTALEADLDAGRITEAEFEEAEAILLQRLSEARR